MAEDGKLEKLESVVNAESRTVTVELAHFSTYILADQDTEPKMLGDVNGDGKVNTTDAKLIMQFELGLIDETMLDAAAADVNGDDKVNALDANYIRRYAAKIISVFPIEEQ